MPLSPTLMVYDRYRSRTLSIVAPALFLTLVKMSRWCFREDMMALYLIATENQMCRLYALTHANPVIIKVDEPV